jgi:hypothetical protein
MKDKAKHCGFRLSVADYETFAMKARAAGLSKQKYFEKLATGQAIVELPVLRMVAAELKRIGNNLNQAVRLLHQNQQPDPLETEKLQKELRETWQSLKQLTADRI